MIECDISGFGHLRLEYLASDYTGTLSLDGKLLPEVKQKLIELSKFLEVYVLTADTFGTAKNELVGVPCHVHVLNGTDLDILKADFVQNLGAEKVVAFGNGLNDRKMLELSRLGFVVMGGEGCAVESLIAADISVCKVADAIDCLLNPQRLLATLRL